MNGRAEHPIESLELRRFLDRRAPAIAPTGGAASRTAFRIGMPAAAWQAILLRAAHGWVDRAGVRHPAFGRVYVWGPGAHRLRQTTRVWQLLPEFRAALVLSYVYGFEMRPARRRQGVPPVLPRARLVVDREKLPAAGHDPLLARQEWLVVAPHALDEPDWDTLAVEEEAKRRVALREAILDARWDPGLLLRETFRDALKLWPVPADAPRLFRWARGYPPWRMELATYAMLPDDVPVPTEGDKRGEKVRFQQVRTVKPDGYEVKPKPRKRPMRRRHSIARHRSARHSEVSSELDKSASDGPSPGPSASETPIPQPVATAILGDAT